MNLNRHHCNFPDQGASFSLCDLAFDKLVRSMAFRLYHRVFTASTGMPLVLERAVPEMAEEGKIGDQSQGTPDFPVRGVQPGSGHQKSDSRKSYRCNVSSHLLRGSVPIRFNGEVVGYLVTVQSLASQKSPKAPAGFGEVARERASHSESGRSDAPTPAAQFGRAIMFLEAIAGQLGGEINRFLVQTDKNDPEWVNNIRSRLMGASTRRGRLGASHLSDTHFFWRIPAQFEQAVGMSSLDFARRCRLENARLRVTRTEADLQDIALTTGYESEEELTEQFIRYLGETPGEFRNRMRKIKAKLEAWTGSL